VSIISLAAAIHGHRETTWFMEHVDRSSVRPALQFVTALIGKRPGIIERTA